MTQPDHTINIELSDEINIFHHLKKYYQEVKTKPQLNFEVPAGFHQHTEFQRDLRHYLLNTVGAVSSDDNADNFQLLLSIETSSDDQEATPTSLPQHTSMVQVPILRCIEKPSSSLPSSFTFTEDSIHANVGFRQIDTIKHHLHNLYQKTPSS